MIIEEFFMWYGYEFLIGVISLFGLIGFGVCAYLARHRVSGGD